MEARTGLPAVGWQTMDAMSLAAAPITTVSDAAIREAVTALRAGDLVAFPTETVYGLGADAMNPAAVRRIFAAKGRPADHPVIVHLLDATWLAQWARTVPPVAAALAQHFWPGPLTLILPRLASVPPSQLFALRPQQQPTPTPPPVGPRAVALWSLRARRHRERLTPPDQSYPSRPPMALDDRSPE